MNLALKSVLRLISPSYYPNTIKQLVCRYYEIILIFVLIFWFTSIISSIRTISHICIYNSIGLLQ